MRDVALPGEDDGLALSLAAALPVQQKDIASDDYRSLYELGAIRKSKAEIEQVWLLTDLREPRETDERIYDDLSVA